MKQPRHTLAVLRRTLGLNQKEMGALVGCSLKTIQAIEYGVLALSPELASATCHETGVGLNWLRKNDVAAPIITDDGKPYTREIFDSVRASMVGAYGAAWGAEVIAVLQMPEWMMRIGQHAIIANHIEKGQLFAYLMHEAIESAIAKFNERVKGTRAKVPSLFRHWLEKLSRQPTTKDKRFRLRNAQEVCSEVLECVYEDSESLYDAAIARQQQPSAKKQSSSAPRRRRKA